MSAPVLLGCWTLNRISFLQQDFWQLKLLCCCCWCVSFTISQILEVHFHFKPEAPWIRFLDSFAEFYYLSWQQRGRMGAWSGWRGGWALHGSSPSLPFKAWFLTLLLWETLFYFSASSSSPFKTPLLLRPRSQKHSDRRLFVSGIAHKHFLVVRISGAVSWIIPASKSLSWFLVGTGCQMQILISSRELNNVAISAGAGLHFSAHVNMVAGFNVDINHSAEALSSNINCSCHIFKTNVWLLMHHLKVCRQLLLIFGVFSVITPAACKQVQSSSFSLETPQLSQYNISFRSVSLNVQ